MSRRCSRVAPPCMLKWSSSAVLLCLSVLSAAVDAADQRLVDAVKSGNANEVRALVAQRTDVNAPQPDGTTALHWAADADNPAIVEALLRAGAQVGAVNRYGITPLWLAALNGNLTTIELLLKNGGDPNTAVPEGETVLMTAA